MVTPLSLSGAGQAGWSSSDGAEKDPVQEAGVPARSPSSLRPRGPDPQTPFPWGPRKLGSHSSPIHQSVFLVPFPLRTQILDLQPFDRQNQASRLPSAPAPQGQESGVQQASSAPSPRSPPTGDEAPSQLGEARSDPGAGPGQASPARRAAAVLYRVYSRPRPRRPGVQVGRALGRPLPRSRLSGTPAAAQALALGSLHPLTPAPSGRHPGCSCGGRIQTLRPWGRRGGVRRGSRAEEVGSGWALFWGGFLARIPSQGCPRPCTLILTSLGEFVQAGAQSSLNLNPFPALTQG